MCRTAFAVGMEGGIPEAIRELESLRSKRDMQYAAVVALLFFHQQSQIIDRQATKQSPIASHIAHSQRELPGAMQPTWSVCILHITCPCPSALMPDRCTRCVVCRDAVETLTAALSVAEDVAAETALLEAARLRWLGEGNANEARRLLSGLRLRHDGGDAQTPQQRYSGVPRCCAAVAFHVMLMYPDIPHQQHVLGIDVM
jgi:hypothetical protein